MNNYLSKFFSTIPVSQREALKSLASNQSIAGSISSFEQLLQGLNALALGSLNAENPRPLSSNLSIGTKAGSPQLNNLFSFLGHDLDTVFNELEALSSFFEQLDRIASSENILVEKQLRELDSALSLVEVLEENSTQGYLVAQFNTFDSGESVSLGSDDNSFASLYKDPRSNKPLRDLLTVDRAREGLILPVDSTQVQKPKTAFVSAGTNTIESDVKFKIVGDDLRIGDDSSNLLKKDNSFWAHFCYLAKDQFRLSPPLSTRAELVVDLGGLASINHLYISPIASMPLVLESVSYEAADSNIYTINDTDVLLNSDTTIVFSAVVASKVFLQLRQNNYERISTNVKSATGPYIEIPEQLQELAGGHGVLAIKQLSGSSHIEINELDGWLYIFALDAVTVGKAKFKPNGIFVSQPLKVEEAIQRVGVKNNLAHATGRLGNQADAFEYWIYRVDEINNRPSTTSLIPIVPLGTQTIEHELLVLGGSGTGELRFFPDVGSDITLYRDFTPLVAGLDFTISVNNGTTYEPSTSYGASPIGPPYKYLIRITSPQSASIYTVTYKPKSVQLSAGFPLYLDRLSTSLLESDNSITFVYPGSTKDKIESSRVYLICIVRSLDHDVYFRSTPILFDYTLLAG